MSFFIRILLLITLAIAFMMTTGCNSLKFKPLVQNVATTGVAYALGGAIPAVVNAAVMVSTEELLEDDTSVEDIKTTPQAFAYVAEKGIESILWFGIIFLILSNILVPLITQKLGYAKAKAKYKEIVFKQDGEL